MELLRNMARLFLSRCRIPLCTSMGDSPEPYSGSSGEPTCKKQATDPCRDISVMEMSVRDEDLEGGNGLR